MLQYLFSTVGQHDLNIDDLDEVPDFVNPMVNDGNSCMTLPKSWPKDFNAPPVIE
jgi:predicted  nucleic acid-binding Zn-ribbon protein